MTLSVTILNVDCLLITGGLDQIVLTPGLKMSVRAARTKYPQQLDSDKEKKVDDERAASQKRKMEELTVKKDKRRRLELDCISLEADADKLAVQAENTSKLTLISKSNALRRAAKTKRDAIKKLDDEIAASLNLSS